MLAVRQGKKILVWLMTLVMVISMTGIKARAEGTGNAGDVKLIDQPEWFDFYIVTDPQDKVNQIKEMTIDGVVQEKKTSPYLAFYGGYYVGNDGRIKMNRPSNNAMFVLNFEDGTKQAYKYDESQPQGQRFVAQTMEEADKTKFFKIRLVGSFEAAMVGQKKYDAISGASTGVSTNKNSNVVIQGAFTDKEDGVPAEEDWKLLHEITNVEIQHNRTKLNVPTETGMEGSASPFDSSVTLSGTPAKAGKYKISVTMYDTAGRTLQSNALPFNIYDTDEKLIDHLKVDHSRKMHDGKYIWDMEPWFIQNFGGTNETVTVPKDIKAWYGSHTSGVYGELGRPVDSANEATAQRQTLIIGPDTDLTLVNMKVKRSVDIIVQKGGTLTLTDSSVYGNIIVEDGGRFHMNYDRKAGKYQHGASIQGQLELKEGAILGDSLIYSHTNYLTDGSKANINVEPVIKVTGNAKIDGNVYVRGDNSATGTDPKTGKPYTGQPAMSIENATLTVPKGNTLGLYGGGNMATTTLGGQGLVLNNGTITGDGDLIAVGGNGFMGAGGEGVTGTGNIDTARAYLHGGNQNSGKTENAKPYADTVTVSKAKTVGVALPGDYVKLTDSESQPDAYWKDTSTAPAPVAFGTELIVAGDPGKEDSGKEDPGKEDPGKEDQNKNNNNSGNNQNGNQNAGGDVNGNGTADGGSDNGNGAADNASKKPSISASDVDQNNAGNKANADKKTSRKNVRKAAKTGDVSGMELFAVLSVLSAGAAIALTGMKRMNRRKKQ